MRAHHRPPSRPTYHLTRQQLEMLIERAISLLDALDGDPDYESQCEDEGAAEGW